MFEGSVRAFEMSNAEALGECVDVVTLLSFQTHAKRNKK